VSLWRAEELDPVRVIRPKEIRQVLGRYSLEE
jgi:hypothetical protein